ncbi:hypothetical protein [Alteromonas sp. M12]|uniref:DUF7000 family protein n=1 Tax=Alteromonas sp. M12 TaxID=3135644 RepID=UPI00319E5823
MSDASFNSRISAYKAIFSSGEIQKTYQDLVAIVQSLRTSFATEYKDQFSVANVLHGYIDFTYFYLQNEFLKNRKLKLAFVFNHQKIQFEIWLLGQKKDVQLAYWKKLKSTKWVNEEVMPEYAIFEIVLLSNPDFNNFDSLSESIHSGYRSLSREICNTLEDYE